MDFYDLFERALKEKGLKPSDVSKGAGISTSTLSEWKKRLYFPKPDKIKLVSDFLEVPVAYFYGVDEAFVLEPETVKVKVLGTVPAGVPIDAVEDIIGEEVISMKDAQTGDFFGLRIKGDSMVPDILPGSIVIVRQQEDVENGDIAIVMINGSEATCKKIEKYDRGIMLVPFNGAYEPQFYSFEDMERMPVRILGKVTEIRRKL